jgi:hypothetical protein
MKIIKLTDFFYGCGALVSRHRRALVDSNVLGIYIASIGVFTVGFVLYNLCNFYA